MGFPAERTQVSPRNLSSRFATRLLKLGTRYSAPGSIGLRPTTVPGRTAPPSVIPQTPGWLVAYRARDHSPRPNTSNSSARSPGGACVPPHPSYPRRPIMNPGNRSFPDHPRQPAMSYLPAQCGPVPVAGAPLERLPPGRDGSVEWSELSSTHHELLLPFPPRSGWKRLPSLPIQSRHPVARTPAPAPAVPCTEMSRHTNETGNSPGPDVMLYHTRESNPPAGLRPGPRKPT